MWNAVLDAGRDVQIVPCGLGARDTLRLEAEHAALRERHGRAHDGRSRPALAGSSDGRKSAFMGAERLREQKAQGLTGSSSPSRWSTAPSPATDTRCSRTRRRVGVVTSGTQTPFLKKAIGLAMVPIGHGRCGHARSTIDIRGRRTPARVVPEPFYKRPGRPPDR